MEIGEFSRKSGITIDTLRYYNKIGLLEPHRIKGRRSYSEEDLEAVLAIKKLKSLDFSLDEIKLLFAMGKNIEENDRLDESSRANIKGCLEVIEEKYKDIVRKEQDIKQVKCMLEKMIEKTNRLLELGYFFNSGDYKDV